MNKNSISTLAHVDRGELSHHLSRHYYAEWFARQAYHFLGDRDDLWEEMMQISYVDEANRGFSPQQEEEFESFIANDLPTILYEEEHGNGGTEGHHKYITTEFKRLTGEELYRDETPYEKEAQEVRCKTSSAYVNAMNQEPQNKDVLREARKADQEAGEALRAAMVKANAEWTRTRSTKAYRFGAIYKIAKAKFDRLMGENRQDGTNVFVREAKLEMDAKLKALIKATTPHSGKNILQAAGPRSQEIA